MPGSNGPYIVTTKRCHLAEPTLAQVQEHPPLSRLAVATLGKAEVARRLFNWREGDALTSPETFVVDAVASVPESGGTVGPLPDGTVIEVRPDPNTVTLRLACPLILQRQWARMSTRERIDAFNARQS